MSKILARSEIHRDDLVEVSLSISEENKTQGAEDYD